MRRSIRRLIVVAFSVGLAGCASHVQPSPATEMTVARYEARLHAWQQAQFHGYISSAAGEGDLVFVVDRRTRPQTGFSLVHFADQPDRALYMYGPDSSLQVPIFSESLAPIMVPFVSPEDRRRWPGWGPRWAYIERSGRFAFPPVFSAANHFDRGVATAQLRVSAAPASDALGRWVLLRKNGSMKLLDPSIAAIEEFSGGLAEFSKVGYRKRGYIDRAGNMVPAIYVQTKAFCANGSAPVKLNEKWGLIDKRGRFVVSPVYDDIDCFSEGLAAARRGKWGFIDATGRFVIPPQFYAVGNFSEGHAQIEQLSWPGGPGSIPVGTFGFVDRSGSKVIPAAYAYAYPFKFGIAKVGTLRQNWLRAPLFVFHVSVDYLSWAYINEAGAVVAPDGQQDVWDVPYVDEITIEADKYPVW
ncbi:MAG: WG repeat-containing protein [Candidatus Eremiobacteraeota bacterium]|nr:WG repeat-containing protein [Candidatus Eremiobacteraeota bacterium]